MIVKEDLKKYQYGIELNIQNKVFTAAWIHVAGDIVHWYRLNSPEETMQTDVEELLKDMNECEASGLYKYIFTNNLDLIKPLYGEVD